MKAPIHRDEFRDMNEQPRFIQFPHPGAEPTLNSGQNWLIAGRPHARKFMQVNGRYCSSADQEEIAGKLRFWGEWEAESELVDNFTCSGVYPMMPRHLWRPYYINADNYEGLQNTDPFVFGDQFIYSNCRQFRHHSLRCLAIGSIILFGSGKTIDGERRFVIDTVFVVQDRVVYDPQHIAYDHWRRKGYDTFTDVTGKPLGCACCSGTVTGCVPGGTTKLSLYFGATPNLNIDGMFSFFPAKPERDDWDFARPQISLCSKYFNPSNWRTVKGVNSPRSCSELSDIWRDIVAQVLDAGLVLGTYAELPPKCG